jgi:hypothetical protein
MQGLISDLAFGCRATDPLSRHAGSLSSVRYDDQLRPIHVPTLQVCNQNARFCMTSLRVALNISRGIYPTKFRDGRTLPTQFGNDAACAKK